MGQKIAESRALQLLSQLRQCVRISRRGIGEHRQAEARRDRWRYAIRIGHELEHDNAAARLQRTVNLREKRGAARGVEMMKEVGDQRDIEAVRKLDFERIAGERVMSILDLRSTGILGCDREHTRPVNRDDLGSWIALGDGDAKEPVTGGDV